MYELEKKRRVAYSCLSAICTLDNTLEIAICHQES